MTHLDVRSKVEYDTTGVVEHSVLIPLPELESRVGDLRDYENIHINCRTGLRARVAFSILARHGIKSKVLSESKPVVI